MKQNKHLHVAFLLPLALATLSACTPYSESFDCPPGHGVGCKSLNAINQMVEEGKLPLENVPLEGNPSEKPPSSFLIEANNRSVLNRAVLNRPIPLLKTFSQVSPSTHMKVWMAAYEDENEVFHTPSIIYVALKKDPHIEENK